MSVFWSNVVAFAALGSSLLAWLDAWKYSNKSRAATKANGDLETTIRTLENRVSDLSDKLSQYEQTTPKLEDAIATMADKLAKYESGFADIERAVTPPSGSESEPQA